MNPSDPSTDVRELPDIVPLEFWTTLEPDATNPSKYHEVEWCRYARRGSVNSTTEAKVSTLKKSTIGHWTVLKRFYEAWKDQRTVEFEGVPLDAWPGISKGAVDVLRKFNILSVEHLAEASDGVIASTGVPSVRELQRRARIYLQNKGQVDAAEARAEQERENENLRAEIAELRNAIRQHAQEAAEAARINVPASHSPTDDGDDPAPAPKRRGRPPRDAAV